MKKIASVALVCFLFNSFSQSFYFPEKQHKDSLSLSTCMSALAKQVLANYKETDKNTFFDNRFRYQIVTKQYKEALESIDSLQNVYKATDPLGFKGFAFQYQTFAATKLQQQEKSILFKEAYKKTFTQLYNLLPKSAIIGGLQYFDMDLKEVRDNFYKLLNNQANKDSISFAGAKQLCRAYNSYLVYTQIVPEAKPLIAEVNNKQFIVEDSVLIKTRDGATISLRVIRNKNINKKQPTVFVFNIYSSPSDNARAKAAAINGYVGVVANTRGKRFSPQEIEPFEHDANDAYDIIDWISKQSWSNGKVGMFGGSYLGFSQWAAVKKVHPALKTIIPQVAVGIGIDYPMQNNVFMGYMLRWIHYVTNTKETDEGEFGDEEHWSSIFKKWYTSGKSFRSLDTIEGRPNKIFQRWLMHPNHDSYWQNMAAYQSDFSSINIPILTITGFYDDDQLGAMYYFNQHHLYNKNANHYLVIGPYDHYGAQDVPSTTLNGYQIDSVANININSLAYQWFDYVLKDSSKPSLLKDKINYQVMGTNKWKHVSSLNKMNNDTLTFYLSSTRVSQYYKMDLKLASNLEYINQEVDFKDRSEPYTELALGKIIDSTLNSSNGISFISKTFDKPFELNGSFIGDLKASINKKDVDVSLAMYELMPNGKYFMLGTHIGRASYAKNKSKRQLLTPDKTENIPINNSFFMAKKIGAGSKLVIVLGVNKNANWQVNYGTGKDVSDETIADAKEPLQIKWYNNSTIKIPIWK